MGCCVQRLRTLRFRAEFLEQNGHTDNTTPSRDTIQDGGGLYAEGLCPALQSEALNCAAAQPRENPAPFPLTRALQSPAHSLTGRACALARQPTPLHSLIKE